MSYCTSLKERVLQAHALLRAQSARSLLSYLDAITIDSSPDPKPYREVKEGWQDMLDRALAPAWEQMEGLRSDYKGPQNFWLTLARGHDKSSRFGRMVNHALCFSRRPLMGVAAASDGDQIELLLEAMQAEYRLNPWLPRLSFGRTRVKGPGGTMKLATSDAPSAFGARTDFIICDELTHWKSEKLWSALWSGREKRQGSLYGVITNAGVLDSWQHKFKLTAQALPDYWWVYEAPEGEQLATWMDAAKIGLMRQSLNKVEAKRVIDNVWVDAAEECGYLTRADVLACEALGRELGLTRAHIWDRNPRYTYWAGIDYGPKRDRTALSVLHYDSDRRLIIVDVLDVWEGRTFPGGEVPISAVEEWIQRIGQTFRPTFCIDPHQMIGTIQRYEGSYMVERFEPRGGKANYEMAQTLRTLVVNRQIAWYPGAGELPTATGFEGLVDELAGLVTRTMAYGYRFDHEAGRHDDRAVAVGMPALHAAEELAAGWVPPGDPVKQAKKETPAVFLPEYIVENRGRGRGIFGIR